MCKHCVMSSKCIRLALHRGVLMTSDLNSLFVDISNDKRNVTINFGRRSTNVRQTQIFLFNKNKNPITII